MGHYDYFPKYVSVAEKKLKAEKSIQKLRKKNPDIAPVVIVGNKLTRTWWGKSWNENLERYSDYSNRIGRGRSYVRNGAVLDLKIKSGKVEALVQGSSAAPYSVEIKISPLNNKNWKTITEACAGTFESLQELVEGKFPKALEELFTAKGEGLFPTPEEIFFECSCPDWAHMCKHVAAVLYGIGARLDDDPKLFFLLRDVNIDELISETVINNSRKLLEKSKVKSGRVMEDVDIAGMFGIDIGDEPGKTPEDTLDKKAKQSRTAKPGKSDKLSKTTKTKKTAKTNKLSKSAKQTTRKKPKIYE